MAVNYKDYLHRIKALLFDVDGVLSGSRGIIAENGELLRTGHIKDGYALQLAAKERLILGVLSGADAASIRIRLELLGFSDIYLGCPSKLPYYEDFKAKYNLKDEEILYMGDDIPDLPVLQKTGIRACPCDAAIEVKECVHYISALPGGEGCVRDMVEQVLRAQGKWMNPTTAFHW